MSEIQINKTGKIPDNVPDDLIVKQVDEAIRYIAYMENKDADIVFADVKGVDITMEKWDEGYMGIYAVIYFESGEKCTLPLVYIFENQVKEATMAHMFSDGECEF